MRIACVQCDVVFNDPVANADRAVEFLRNLKGQNVELAIFPEAFLTGYCVDCAEDAEAIALDVAHDQLERLRRACEELDMLAVFGFAERRDDGSIRNTAVLFEPGTEPRYYRKTHLPHLGLDRFVERGEELPVYDTRVGRLGILICFDLRPPEAARVLALNGAEIILLPTNWPAGAEVSADHIAISRAAENRVFVATCNRVGVENGTRFIGLSKIIGINGEVLAEAFDDEAVIIADIQPEQARDKRIVRIPGSHEMELFDTRNPNLYQSLLEEAKRTSGWY
jgi:5-aminopentanamidase